MPWRIVATREQPKDEPVYTFAYTDLATGQVFGLDVDIFHAYQVDELLEVIKSLLAAFDQPVVNITITRTVSEG